MVDLVHLAEFDLLSIMNLDELWIGDKVWVCSKQVPATFEGIVDPDRAKIKIGSKYIVIAKSDLDYFHEQDGFNAEEPDPVIRTTPFDRAKFSTTLDLHAEKLNLGSRDLEPQKILSKQLKTCRTFLEKAIQRRVPRVIIIHGKGKGILKHEVGLLLEEFPEVSFTFPVHQGGGLEVLLVYQRI